MQLELRIIVLARERRWRSHEIGQDFGFGCKAQARSPLVSPVPEAAAELGEILPAVREPHRAACAAAGAPADVEAASFTAAAEDSATAAQGGAADASHAPGDFCAALAFNLSPAPPAK